jgi:transmembrane sensor
MPGNLSWSGPMDESEKHPESDHRIALEARDWIVRLTSGNVGDAEIERFKSWRDLSLEHRRAFDRERIFWQQLPRLDGMPHAAAPSPPVRRMGRRAFLIGGGAAGVAAASLFAAPRLDFWLNADFSTGIGEQAEFALPDGSVAALNTDSAIALDFRPDLRLVRLLKGEAEFRVRPLTSSFFRVATLGGNSDAFGTTFAVKALEGRATVTVTEGQVRVSAPAAPDDPAAPTAASVDLAANEQTSYAEGAHPHAATPADSEMALAWRQGRVIFEGLPFAGAMAELGRYVPERIVMAPGVRKDVPVSAIFSTREALAAVEALARTQGRSARRIPGLMIVIS